MDLVKLEQEVLDFWQREKIFEQSLKLRQGKPAFVFYEGPPSANAKPGIHHVLARAFKDLIPRYKTMRGFYVARKAGWDTHGLPIEVQAEKELGLKSKKDIEKYGVAKFNAYCRKLVFRYQKEWEQLTRRIGFWLDLEHPYITCENEYIEKLWGIVKTFHDKKLLYKGYKVVPYCPRCGTPLSSHEVAQGYADVTEPAVYVKFKISDGAYKDNYIIAWTTTPWTLPGNVALAVNKDIKYVRVGDLIVAKDRVSSVQPDNTPEVKSGITPVQFEKLLGSHYEPLYPVIAERTKDMYTIVAADFVTTQEGTGVVHTAVMYGEDDYKLADTYALPKVHTVADDGTFKDFVKPFAGKFVKDADKDIITDLKKRGLLVKQENHTHTYPFCWRCNTPLLYFAKDSWFVKMSSLRKQLVANNATIKWVPEHLRDGRFGEFLKEAKDWAFSRDRYWGTPLPVWQCKNGHVKVIGSAKELPKKLSDLHRPFIDDITFTCLQCKETMRREPYVIDVWFDSGAMPYASGEKAAGRFPADFIAEAIDQTRGWFYTLLAVSTILDNKASYTAVISTGHVFDEHGKKMSKSKGNVIEPDAIIDKHGADALRWYFYVINQPGDGKAFVEKDMVIFRNQTLGLLWNVYNYYETYKPSAKHQAAASKFMILDHWMMARQHRAIEQITDNIEQYKITEAAREIMAFINDISTWYVRRSRSRTDKMFFTTLYSVIVTTTKLIAPFMPFNAESLYSKISEASKISSVHLEDWPKHNEKLIDRKLLADMAEAREIVSQALKLRADAKIKIRQPLNQLSISSSQFSKEILELIADEVNVKNIVVGKTLQLDINITPELEQEGIARDVVRMIQDLRKQAGYTFSDRVKAFYEVRDEKTESAVSRHRDMIERETLTKLSKGIPLAFDKELKASTIHLAVRS